MSDDALPRWLADMEFPLDQKMGFEMHELSPQRVVGSIPVEGNTQPFGLLHGGASAVLLESLASMGAVAHGYPDKMAVGVDLNITHLRSVRTGRVTGTATAIHLGSKVASYRVDIHDDEGRLVSTGRLTCHMLPAPDAG